jgi:hypothetical protein
MKLAAAVSVLERCGEGEIKEIYRPDVKNSLFYLELMTQDVCCNAT